MELLEKTFYNNTVLEWLLSLSIIVGSVIISKVVYKLINRYAKKWAAKTKNNYDDIIVDKMEEPLTTIIIILGIICAVSYLHLPVGIDKFIFGLGKLSITLTFTWLLSRTFGGLADEFTTQLINKSDNEFYGQVLPLLKKAVNVVLWSMGLIIGLDNIGVDVTAMIAGLGVGGLALALAAQDIIKNIFGGIMIFLDKPFKIGERIQVDGFDGTVEEIGLRSTRVRTLEGRVVTIPNCSFSDNSVINVTSEPARKIKTSIGLTYDMTPEQMDEGIDVLNDIAGAAYEDGYITDNFAIAFNNFGAFSLDLIFIYRISGGQDNLKVQTRINREILRRFNNKGLEMAFPTQTILHQEIK